MKNSWCIGLLFAVMWAPSICAQDLLPVIRLTAEHVEQAKAAAEALRECNQRHEKATAAWRNLHARFTAQYPELGGVRIAESADLLIGMKRTYSDGVSHADMVVLSAEEAAEVRQSREELESARNALQEARKQWLGFQYRVALAHLQKERATAKLIPQEGRADPGQTPWPEIPMPWTNGMVFSKDFRVAFPPM